MIGQAINIDNTYGINIKAESASTYLDYDGIVKACDNIINEAKESMNDISKRLENVKCGSDVLSSQDKSMQPIIEEAAEIVTTIPDSIESSLEALKQEVLEKYNGIQTELNNKSINKFNQILKEAKEAAQNRHE